MFSSVVFPNHYTIALNDFAIYKSIIRKQGLVTGSQQMSVSCVNLIFQSFKRKCACLRSGEKKKNCKPCAIAKLVHMFKGTYLIFVEEINLNWLKIWQDSNWQCEWLTFFKPSFCFILRQYLISFRSDS